MFLLLFLTPPLGCPSDVTVVACVSPFVEGGGPRVVVSTAAFHARVRGSFPGLGGLKETKMFLPHPLVKLSIMGSLCDREVACSASDHQGSNFESCVWRAVSSHSSHHTQEVLLVQFSLCIHKSGLKPDSFHFIYFFRCPPPPLAHHVPLGCLSAPTALAFVSPCVDVAPMAHLARI